MTKRYKSKALEALHSTMSDLFKAGGIDKQTMRYFDEGCLLPAGEYIAPEIQGMDPSQQINQVKLDVLRKAIEDGINSSDAQGDPFERVRQHILNLAEQDSLRADSK
jgi:hypothetical protein